ncbi:MAG TPA: hypothetical protein EYQ77_02750 [Methylococcaceae bacterium]|jgi:hypothetical protein|nr:hypothetical protein [Methylococcaceae bacterium]
MKRTEKANQKRISNSDEFALRMVEELELDVVHPKTGKILPKPTTLDEKASFLNQRNLLRPRGSLWDRTGVSRLIKRVEKIRQTNKIK